MQIKGNEYKSCDVCGKKATRLVIFNSEFGKQLIPQKVFYCCDSEKCFKRLQEYAKERHEIITTKKIKQ